MSYLRPVATMIGVAVVAAYGIVACTQDFEKFDASGPGQSTAADASLEASKPPAADGSVTPPTNLDADALPCSLAASCVATKTTCGTTCEQTKTTCVDRCGNDNRCKT